MRHLIFFCLLLLALPAMAETTITYQGQLQNDGEPFNGVVDMSFVLHEHDIDDLPIGSTISLDQVAVNDGLFTVELDFGEIFTGQPLWLEASVNSTPLTPRQKITAVPMALNVPAGAGSNWQRVNDDIYFNGGKAGIGIEDPGAMLQVSGSSIFGDVGNQAVALNSFVSGGRPYDGSPSPNSATGDASFVGGGNGNSASSLDTFVGAGFSNSASGRGSIVVGGHGNSATGSFSGVASGESNIAGSPYTFIGGGRHNVTNGINSFIGGGHTNSANGTNGFIAGGSYNETDGLRSFAAGNRAKALHDGTFVFADSSTTQDLETTQTNQFLVRAQNGIGLNTDTPLRGGLHFKQQAVGGLSQIGLVLERGGSSTNNWAFYVATSDNLGFRYNDDLVARIDTAGQFATLSDARFKTDIEPIEDPLARVLELEPAQYRMKSGTSDSAHSLGLIAQQVRDVIPAAVSDAEDTLGIRYNQITALNTAAIIELHAAMHKDRNRMAELQAENETLRKRLADRSIRDDEIRGIFERNEELEQRLLALEALLIGETRMGNHAESATSP